MKLYRDTLLILFFLFFFFIAFMLLIEVTVFCENIIIAILTGIFVSFIIFTVQYYHERKRFINNVCLHIGVLYGAVYYSIKNLTLSSLRTSNQDINYDYLSEAIRRVADRLSRSNILTKENENFYLYLTEYLPLIPSIKDDLILNIKEMLCLDKCIIETNLYLNEINIYIHRLQNNAASADVLTSIRRDIEFNLELVKNNLIHIEKIINNNTPIFFTRGTHENILFDTTLLSKEVNSCELLIWFKSFFEKQPDDTWAKKRKIIQEIIDENLNKKSA